MDGENIMECGCKGGKTNDLKIEGDMGTDPFWCNICGFNLEMEGLPISDELAEELSSWIVQYGEWIDWENDTLLPGAIQLEEEFNQAGAVLAEKAKQELDGKYKITYSPAKSTEIYT
ncbi:hypothetical protein [Metabacillus fastidiosus]|uniref:hypothetical protein n=1 Tax=Metabacillus fastidiosus TaxID=1458 RepID=UPI003D2BF9A3